MTAARKPADPYRSAAAVWGALARRYRDTYADRHALPLSAEELAARLGYARQTVYAIEKGEHVPGDRQRAARWDQEVDADGVLLMLWPLASQLGTTLLQDYLASKEAAYSESRRRNSSPQEDDRVERRQLLQLALAAAGTGPLLTAGEPVRQLLERLLPVAAMESAAERDLADWDLICADHLHAVVTRPPAQVVADLIPDLLALERRLQHADDRTAAELQRFAARLSAVQANALTRLGDHGSALRWWRTARHAADTSGDLDLSLWVRGTEGIFGLYGQRAPSTVLHLVDEALKLASGDRRSGPGAAKAIAARSQAMALLGRHSEAIGEVRRLADMVAALPAVYTPFGWAPDGLSFVESWAYALQGDESKAGVAREAVIRRAPIRGCYQNTVNVRLHEALVTAVAGGADQGARKAAEIIDAVPAAYRSHMIMETGRLVLRSVPQDQRSRPAVQELHEIVGRTPAQLV